MALGLSVIQTTKEGFLNQLKRFDSVTLNERGEFACWIEGSCNFYIAEDVSATELGAFAAEVEEHLVRIHKSFFLARKVESKNIGKASSIEGLQLDDLVTIATHHVRDEDDFRVWCECGEELHWCDDGSLSDCNRCTPP